MHDKNLALVIEDKTLTPRFLSPSGPLWYIIVFIYSIMLQPIAPHVRTVRKMAGRGSYEILSLAESVNVFCSNLKRLRSCLSFLIPESFNKCNFHTSNS